MAQSMKSFQPPLLSSQAGLGVYWMSFHQVILPLEVKLCVLVPSITLLENCALPIWQKVEK